MLSILFSHSLLLCLMAACTIEHSLCERRKKSGCFSLTQTILNKCDFFIRTNDVKCSQCMCWNCWYMERQPSTEVSNVPRHCFSKLCAIGFQSRRMGFELKHSELQLVFLFIKANFVGPLKRSGKVYKRKRNNNTIHRGARISRKTCNGHTNESNE